MQHARSIANATGIQGHIDDLLLDRRRVTSVAIFQQEGPSTPLETRPAPIPLLAFAVQLLNVIVDIIANNPIAQKVVELSSSQPYSLVEHSLYRFVFPPQGV